MNILIAGASGFIGTELVNFLSPNHRITVLGRNLEKLEPLFPKDIAKLTWQNLNNQDAKQYDLIINLSGSNIGAKRWNTSVKKELIESRTLTNQQLIEWLVKHNAKPRFICANAVGIYGAQAVSLDTFDEDTLLTYSAKDDFLQQIGFAWEQSLQPAIDADIPVTITRFGVVLKQGEGMLKKLELPFRLGLGSIIGDGEQILSWIHYQDLISALNFLIEHPQLQGSINITAPYPVAQKEFAKELANILNRPLFLKLPSWFIKTVFGEMGDYLLLKGQKVVSKRLSELGFEFTYPKINKALDKEYARPL